MKPSRRLATAPLLILALLVSGCAEPIESYEVPYTQQRLLGAMIFLKDAVWFAKLMGPANEVSEHKESFEAFVRSLKFPIGTKEPVTWALPEGWVHEQGGSELRYATFHLPNRLDVTFFKFKGDAGQVLPNINRWRGQLNLNPIESGEELLRIARQEKLADDVPALIVDMESLRVPPIVNFKATVSSQKLKPVRYEVPEGWTEKDDPGSIAVAAFVIDENGQKAEVTITPAGGDVTANINRWRDQVGLPAQDEETIRKAVEIKSVDQKQSVMIELHGEKNRSILGVICPGSDRTWFLKMTGDTELVKRNRPKFEQFMGTIRFGGGN